MVHISYISLSSINHIMTETESGKLMIIIIIMTWSHWKQLVVMDIIIQHLKIRFNIIDPSIYCNSHLSDSDNYVQRTSKSRDHALSRNDK